MAKKYRSIHAECVHRTASGFLRAGLITKEEMKEFDDSCLVGKEKDAFSNVRELNGRGKIAKQSPLKKAP